MLRVPIYVNDRRIAHLGVHNTGETIDGVTEYDVYDLTVGDGDTLDNYIKIDEVHHDRDDGASKLVERVMATVDEDEYFD